MTALERMARAMGDRAGSTEYGPVVPESLLIPMIRAALQAIREPDDRVRYDGDRALVNALHSGKTSVTDAALRVHQAMIDAILNETPE